MQCTNTFNIKLLASCLTYVTSWISQSPHTRSLILGYFGASTGTAAALIAATLTGPINNQDQAQEKEIAAGTRFLVLLYRAVEDRI